ncbi:hypothetical protein [Campylobacter insulaenigrae]|uniref:Uncharacterized protein n=1 Tax=Campylobacter insulaenigrae NCTC 12927 TaxID=1031564 RepID=A0A0A8H1D7_9BACT|nr:hypothetical protein [Campylobacter insulaenigrae]AJC87772.1 hypothetical protein CINS_0808 [Campylobacter insulaenigrae NCTC 12927]VEH94090.1 Uncharacterised protein [Campylobacter insulaenigrae]
MIEQTYELKFEYLDEENATLFFQKITDFLLSIDKLNNSLVSIFSVEVDVNIQIKSIDKGSIKIWIVEKLSKISDEDIKHYVNNPKELFADLLIKSKKMILEKIQAKQCSDIPKKYKDIIEESDLKNFGYNNNEADLLSCVSDLTYKAKEFKHKPMIIFEEKVYGINETFDYNLKTADGVKEQISRMQGAFIIKKPDLTGESKWEIVNDKIIKVKINDENFKKKLKNRKIKLSYGDMIEGNLICKTYISKNLEVLENEYFLEDIKGVVEPNCVQEQSLFKDKEK